MREVMNISLPRSLYKNIETEVERGGFASKSEFFRHIFRFWQEKKLASEAFRSRAEIKSGRGRKLNSLKDLR